MAVPGNAGKDSEGIWFEVAPACRGTDGCNPGGRIGVLGVVRTHDDREAVEDGPNERTDANIDCNIIDGGGRRWRSDVTPVGRPEMIQ